MKSSRVTVAPVEAVPVALSVTVRFTLVPGEAKVTAAGVVTVPPPPVPV
jgi:hypothetical protein